MKRRCDCGSVYCDYLDVADGIDQGMREGAPVGRKDDSSKLRYDLIPPYALEALAHVYTIGANKYGDGNYLKGMDWSRVYGALLRHIQAFWMGETFDPEDDQEHLASVAWCAFTLLTFEVNGIGNDDRSDL
ncbi:hypothetical protein LCGC14_0910080 [marine sediment metagenome]|uniref:dATP/dGTP diphosphohydrolase N-terminal domain-containing protein n=1 Tax=marine sediment metagenome TaxID=412755 RepID=A0A0F9S0Q1_9ZZZZ